MNTIINRRQFISYLIAAGFTPQLFANSPQANEYFISAQGKNAANYGITRLNKTTNKPETTLSGFRGHGLAQNPARLESLLMFSRRPGKAVIEVNIITGKTTNQFTTTNNRTLMGHGCFSHNGKLLYTTETDLTTGAGKIAVRETENYQLLTEFNSYGIGPHEIKLMPDNSTLVIANGGILTHPDSGRKKLNLDTMKSSLTYIDSKSGNKIADYFVNEPKASIRHLDVAHDGTVAIAMQVQRKAMTKNQTVALSAIHKPGEKINLLTEPATLIDKMNDYMGSVTINNQSRIAGFTSPRGNLAAFWNMETQHFAGYHRLNDVCGLSVSSDQQRFILSNSQGEIRQLNAFTLQEEKSLRQRLPGIHWDNHMLTASL